MGLDAKVPGGTSGHGINAIASWSAPMEFISACAGMCASQANYIGCSIAACLNTRQAATATTFVTSSMTPVNIVNSTTELVPLAWAQSFVHALNVNGVPNEFQSLAGSKHAMAYESVVLLDGGTVLHHTAQFLLDHSYPSEEG